MLKMKEAAFDEVINVNLKVGIKTEHISLADI